MIMLLLFYIAPEWEYRACAIAFKEIKNRMFREIAFDGLLFSPFVIYFPLAFLVSYVLRSLLFKWGVYSQLWKAAWFEVSLFVCVLALVMFIGESVIL